MGFLHPKNCKFGPLVGGGENGKTTWETDMQLPGQHSKVDGYTTTGAWYWNFPNQFTAEYLFLIDATNSTIPRVNQPSKDRKVELDAQWTTLKGKAASLKNTAIPAFNKKLWEAGIGAIRISD